MHETYAKLRLCGSVVNPCRDRVCRMRETQANLPLYLCVVNPLRGSCVSDARNLGETAFVRLRGQPSAEIVHVGCAKPRRNCVCAGAWSTLCGDRARRMRETQAKLLLCVCMVNPLRRSCVSDARNLGETALCALRGRPSARSCVSNV